MLFGWLMLLVPMKAYNSVHKLITTLKYIIIKDMFPWILIYLTISMGFAAAIKLQFARLPSLGDCIGDQSDLAGFLNKTRKCRIRVGGHHFRSGEQSAGSAGGHVSVLMLRITAHSWSLSLTTAYGVISALVLLNMLIAIMSNTVTEAQRDKGWRQFQVSKICI